MPLIRQQQYPILSAPWRPFVVEQTHQTTTTLGHPRAQPAKTTMPHSGMTPAELAKFMSRGRRKNPEDEEPIFMRLDRIVD